MPGEHARLSPSDADAWMVCAAKPRLCEGLPERTSEYAEEGTRAHRALEDALRNHGGRIDPAKCDNDEMIEALRFTLKCIEEERHAYKVVERFESERRVYPVRGRDDLWGTGDVIIAGQLRCGRRAVSIIDLKYGRHQYVPPDSAQLGIYALGAAEEIGGLVDVFRSVVVQPRFARGGDLVRVHERDRHEMLGFLGEVRRAAAATDDPDAKPVAGSHCKWCLAKDSCVAYAHRPRKSGHTNEDDFGLVMAG